MKIHIKARYFYIAVIILLISSTLAALYDGSYHIEGGAITLIAFASIITSLVPYFISMRLFRKHEIDSNKKNSSKIWGLILYLFCFPIKIWIIYSNIALLINGGNGWSLG